MNSHKSLGCLFGGLIFLVTLVGGSMIYWKLNYYRVWLSTTSPNQKYTVELTGDKGRGGILYAVVKYNLLVNKEEVTRDRLLHYGDFMDISFELAYPEHAWINENTLRFWSDRHLNETRLDTLLISNNTHKRIKFLEIKTWDLFFVFDVQPRSELKLGLTHRSEGTGVSVEGEFEDGSAIAHTIWFSQGENTFPVGYCMKIDYAQVTINSPKARGYDSRGSWDNLNINPAPECTP